MVIRPGQYIDLHVHTTVSDGTLEPRETVKAAALIGLRAISVTDHDTVDGVVEAVEAGFELGVEVIPGVEISVDHAGGEMHILGYCLDIHSPALQESLRKLQDYRNQRNPLMVKKLCGLGVPVTLEEVQAAAGGDIVGRPHFAAVLVEKGYVADYGEAFDRYLAKGRPAYVKKEKLTPEEGVEVISKAGGIAVLAHPASLTESMDKRRLRDLMQRLKSAGLRGIEVYYSGHSPSMEGMLKSLAAEEELLVTGGTDFHGANKPEIAMGTGLGNLRIPYVLAERLAKAAGWRWITQAESPNECGAEH